MHEHIVISQDSEDFPNSLKVLKDIPGALFAQGNTSALTARPLIAIVGKRECTEFGARSARDLAAFLTRNGYNVVSGLATGIDAAAHQGALDADGQTVAVLFDIRRISPRKNSGLAEAILEKGGLLLAENPPGTKYSPHLLIDRNRIITALASAVFIIETDGKGGSAHTLRFTRECRRPVFCIDPDELRQHSSQEYATGIAGIVREPQTWVYRTSWKRRLLNELEKAISA
jgi:DNA processing protein